jgi:hypothetical protein
LQIAYFTFFTSLSVPLVLALLEEGFRGAEDERLLCTGHTDDQSGVLQCLEAASLSSALRVRISLGKEWARSAACQARGEGGPGRQPSVFIGIEECECIGSRLNSIARSMT